MKIDKLYKIEELVTDILMKDKRARKDDFYLISELIRRVKPAVLGVSLLEALLTAKEKNLPPFESITRARRKVQRENPSLKDLIAEKARLNETDTYMEFALGGSYEKRL